MGDGLDWLFRPFMRGKCKYTDLFDGTLALVDIARINDLLNIADENEARSRQAIEDAQKRG
jgi:hypothetical protein